MMVDTFGIPAEVRNRARILVVEDNLLNQKLDAFLLSGWGLRHEICDNGFAAINSLRRSHYDLVLMDIRLPVLSGLEATRFIRRELGLKVPVVGVTADATAEEKNLCIDAGMNNYLRKPVDDSELLAVIRDHLVPQHAELSGEVDQ